jgi:hypothetical protein
MRVRSIGLFAAAIVLCAASAFAQEATIFGAVTDSTSGALPGVTITATSITNGRVFSSVSDERGEYRLRGLAPDRYKVQAELSGFATVIVPDVEVLVGQNRPVPFAMQVATLSETLTVTGEAPLVDISSTQVAGNVDRRQMEELPLQGRNWMELAMQVKGITANAVDNNPGVRDRAFQLNLDGQEITQQVAGGGFGQPRFSREAIAEFQVITNLFDITQGRSLGIQVQAISRSGTNNLDGAVYGFFRDDKLNAKDFIANRVLPYANQQIGAAVGGPIVHDKLHYFLSYERENEPNTIVTTPPAIGTTYSFDSKLVQNSFLGRADWQLRQGDHITSRWSYWDWSNPFTQVSGIEHPSQAADRSRKAFNVSNTWAKVLSDSTIQEVRLSYSHFDWKNQLAVPALKNTPNYVFQGGLTAGGRRNYPQNFNQNTYSVRYDLTSSVGKHDLKIGAEYLRWKDTGSWELLSRGEFTFNNVPADLARRFPVWDDPTTWDLSGLDANVLRYDQNFGDWTIDIPRPTIALWIGDTWKINNALTVNGGLRWDADFGALDPPHITTQVTFDPRPGLQYPSQESLAPGQRLYPGGLRDINNIAPRGGFTWNVGGRGSFVVRGGSGLYFSIPDSNTTFSHQSFNGERILVNSFPNDNLPGFIQNPTRGITSDDIFAGRVPLPAQSPRVIASDYKMPYTWQSSVGFQTQFGTRWGFEADLTHWKGYNFARQRDPNLAFNPVTGTNVPPTAATRPDPKFGQIQWLESKGRADYAALQTGINKRYSSNWQSSLTYTYMFFMNDDTTNFQYQGNNPFRPEDEWARSTDFQRHTLRLNALWRGPLGINLSGAYFFGSGNYYATTISGNPTGHTGTNRTVFQAPVTVAESARDRFDGPTSFAIGDIVPRNALKGDALHRFDFRVAKEIPLPGGMTITGIAEVFNAFNHKNFGAYQSVINQAGFGDPRQNLLNAYQPRIGQLAFRLAF